MSYSARWPESRSTQCFADRNYARAARTPLDPDTRHPAPACHTSHPPVAHSTYHPASTLTSTCHPRGTAICLFYPGTGSALGVKVADRQAGTAQRRLAPGCWAEGQPCRGWQRSGDWPTGLLHQSGGAQQLNTWRSSSARGARPPAGSTWRRGPGDGGSGDDGSRDGWRRAWARGLGPGRPGFGEDGSEAARAGPGRRPDGGRGQATGGGAWQPGGGWRRGGRAGAGD